MFKAVLHGTNGELPSSEEMAQLRTIGVQVGLEYDVTVRDGKVFPQGMNYELAPALEIILAQSPSEIVLDLPNRKDLWAAQEALERWLSSQSDEVRQSVSVLSDSTLRTHYAIYGGAKDELPDYLGLAFSSVQALKKSQKRPQRFCWLPESDSVCELVDYLFHDRFVHEKPPKVFYLLQEKLPGRRNSESAVKLFMRHVYRLHAVDLPLPIPIADFETLRELAQDFPDVLVRH